MLVCPLLVDEQPAGVIGVDGQGRIDLANEAAADMLGLDPALQRDKLMQSLNVIVRLMRGERVTEKTEWYDLRDAKLQIPPYTYPMMEMAVASSRSPVGSLNAGLHGIGMLAMGAGGLDVAVAMLKDPTPLLESYAVFPFALAGLQRCCTVSQ